MLSMRLERNVRKAGASSVAIMWVLVLLLGLSGACTPEKSTPRPSDTVAPEDIAPPDATDVAAAGEDTDVTANPPDSGPLGDDLVPDPGRVPPPLDLSAISAHLEERASKWVDERKCALSCHTTVPFMMAHPLLTAAGTELAAKIILRVEERVETWPNVSHFYLGQPTATEGILNALALLQYDAFQNQPLRASTCKAVQDMWTLQRNDGGFDWWSFNLYPFELAESNYWAGALISYTLAKAQTAGGCPAAAGDSATLKKLHTWLAQNQTSTDAHGQLWYLLANHAWAGALIDDQTASQMRGALRARQRDDGGFGVKDFLPLDAAIQSDAYTSAIAAVVLSAGKTSEDAAAAEKVHAWMSGQNTLEALQQFKSPNKPDKDFNNALFADTNIAYWLWYQRKLAEL